jgi:hypothetical protein
VGFETEGVGVTDSTSNEPEYIVEYVDGPLAGTDDRRLLVDGEIEPRIGAFAAVQGLESVFWYLAGEQRELDGETRVAYHFDRSDSDPVSPVRETE